MLLEHIISFGTRSKKKPITNISRKKLKVSRITEDQSEESELTPLEEIGDESLIEPPQSSDEGGFTLDEIDRCLQQARLVEAPIEPAPVGEANDQPRGIRARRRLGRQQRALCEARLAPKWGGSRRAQTGLLRKGFDRGFHSCPTIQGSVLL